MPIAPAVGAALIAGGVTAAGMGMQAQANKKQRAENEKMMQKQLQNQKELNEFNTGLGLETWDKTNFAEQRKQIDKAGLSVGLMYGKGGQGGMLGSQGGSASAGQVPDYGDQVGKMAGMGMQAGLQLQLLKAQKENVEADTANKQQDTVNKAEGTAGITADSKNKTISASLNDQSYLEQLEALKASAQKAVGEAKKAGAEGEVAQATVNQEIEQRALKTAIMGVELTAKETGITLTEAQIKETGSKIEKNVAEIQRMQDMTELQKQDLLQRKMQVDFNTSTPAQIKQWTDIATQLLGAFRGAPSYNNTTNNTNPTFNTDKSSQTNNF